MGNFDSQNIAPILGNYAERQLQRGIMNERDFHSVLEQQFSAFLQERGYPDGSLIYEPRLKGPQGKLYIPDFLIVDPTRNERLAIVEVKRQITGRIKGIQEQLEQYKKAAGDSTLPAFLVTPNDEPQSKYPFNLHIFNSKNQLEIVDFRLFPAFSALSSNQTAEKKQNLKQEKEQISNAFDLISHITAFALVVLLIADFLCSLKGITLLTAERLALLGGAVVMVVIPFAQKFKGLGIEWERAQDKSKGS